MQLPLSIFFHARPRIYTSGLQKAVFDTMLYKILNTTPQETLNATTVANTLSVLNGADILRVHDVREAVETLKILEAYNA